MIRAEHLLSPLVYQRAQNIQRISLVDDDVTDFKKGDVYFAATKKYNYYGSSDYLYSMAKPFRSKCLL